MTNFLAINFSKNRFFLTKFVYFVAINRLRPQPLLECDFSMPTKILSLSQESQTTLESILSSSLSLKYTVKEKGWGTVALNKSFFVFQIFFEPSTRTRVSFETAAGRLGVTHSYFQMDGFTSMSKGEGVLDSLRVFEQNAADLFIIRSGTHPEVLKFFESCQKPMISAGYGELYHPTQALLDLITILEHKKSLNGLNVLFVGDIKNSRVAGSHSIIAPKLGYNLGQCSEEKHWLTDAHWQKFTDLKQAMQWADVVIRLRTQKERGSESVSKDYMITRELLEKSNTLLMHPGPFLRGEDFEEDLPEHKNSLIWQQKENGLYVRAYLIKQLLTGETL